MERIRLMKHAAEKPNRISLSKHARFARYSAFQTLTSLIAKEFRPTPTLLPTEKLTNTWS